MELRYLAGFVLCTVCAITVGQYRLTAGQQANAPAVIASDVGAMGASAGERFALE